MDKLAEKEQVIIASLSGGITTRKLARESVSSRATISRWVRAERKAMGRRARLEVSEALKGNDDMPTEVSASGSFAYGPSSYLFIGSNGVFSRMIK